nr:DUF2695 domain-containing protein [Glycomyces sp. L485]
MGLDREQLDQLYEFVDSRLNTSGCDYSQRFAIEWLEGRYQVDTEAVLAGLRELGGYCDCEIMMNTDPDQTV